MSWIRNLRIVDLLQRLQNTFLRYYKKAIKFILYLIFLWLILEGGSYVITYLYYTVIDKQNQHTTELRLNNLRSFFKHPLFSSRDKIEYLNPRVYDAFIAHRYAQNAKHAGLEVDSYGFIHNGDADRQPFSDSKAIKVVLLGGSSMAGTGVTNNQCTIASYLERQLNHNSTAKYEVVNAGQGGYYSPIELSYFTIELVNYQPDFVIALDGFNDFWHSFVPSNDSANYEDWAMPQRSSYHRKIEASINGESQRRETGELWKVLKEKRISTALWYTLNLMSQIVDRISASDSREIQNGVSVWGGNSLYIRDNINNTYSHIPFMEKNWRSLIGAAMANDVKPILLLQPVLPVTKKTLTDYESKNYDRFFSSRPHFSKEQYEKSIEVFYSKANEMIKRIETSFPDPDRVIVDDISNVFVNDTLSMFVDNVHYSHFGNRKIANILATKISKAKNGDKLIDTLCDNEPFPNSN